MRVALALVVMGGCGASTEPQLPSVQDLPLAGHAATDPPKATRLVHVLPDGRLLTAETTPPWDAPGDGSARDRALAAAARDPSFARPPNLQRGELVGVYALPVIALDAAPLVLAPPGTPALAIVRVAATSGALLGISLGDRAAIYDLGFGPKTPDGDRSRESWIELASDADAFTLVDARSGETRTVPLHAGIVDSDALRRAVADLPRARTVDILVGPELTAQQLVDALAVLRDGHGVQLVDVRKSGPERRAELAQARAPHVAIGQPNAQGDLDKALIRKTINTVSDNLLRCYTAALETAPALGGTVSVQFVIGTTGSVTNASSAGVTPAVATCVTLVIQRLTFPHPKGGGIVQVNYPFSFHQGY